MSERNDADVLDRRRGPRRADAGDRSGATGRLGDGRGNARRGRAAGRTLQCRQRPVDGGVPPARDRARRARGRAAGRLSPRCGHSHLGHRLRNRPRQDSLPRRALYGERRPGHLVADAGAAASRQSDLPRAGAARRRRGDAALAHPERDARRRYRATRGSKSSPTAIDPRQERDDDDRRPLCRGLRRRSFPSAPRDRRRFARRCGGVAGPDVGHPGARSARDDAWACLGDRLHQSAQSRPRFRDRRARAMDRPQIRRARRDDAFGPRTKRPRHPRRRPVVRVRNVEPRGLGRAADARRPFPRSARLSRAAMRRISGFPSPPTA